MIGNQHMGTCSRCGGQVMGFFGPWGSILPPPPPTCSSCGAIAASHAPRVIETVPPPKYDPRLGYVNPAPNASLPYTVGTPTITFQITS